MEYQLLIAGFLLGMLIGALIMIRIYDKHSKEMQEIDDDFEKWKVQRHKQFVDELDEMNSRSHEYWRDEAIKSSKQSEYVVIPNTINPKVFMNAQGHKIGVYTPEETDRILRSERDD